MGNSQGRTAKRGNSKNRGSNFKIGQTVYNGLKEAEVIDINGKMVYVKYANGTTKGLSKSLLQDHPETNEERKVKQKIKENYDKKYQNSVKKYQNSNSVKKYQNRVKKYQNSIKGNKSEEEVVKNKEREEEYRKEREEALEKLLNPQTEAVKSPEETESNARYRREKMLNYYASQGRNQPGKYDPILGGKYTRKNNKRRR